MTVELQEGDTVFSVLQRVVSDYNIQMEYSVSPLYQTTYIEGLGNLYEKDCGALRLDVCRERRFPELRRIGLYRAGR